MLFGLILLPLILLTPTIYNLSSINLSDCQPTENTYFIGYDYLLSFVAFFWIIILAFTRYKKSEAYSKKQILLIIIGIELFISFFIITGFFADLLYNFFNKSYELEQYGLFGMPVFIAFLAYSIVKFKTFNIKLIGANVLIVSLWLLVASLFFIADIATLRVVAGITLLLITILGYYLIKSVRREVQQREELLVMTKMFQAVNKQLDELNKFKSEFLSFASHQIKAPMAIIKGYAELLFSGSFGQIPDSAKDAVLKIKQSTKNLVELVNDFLDMRKIEEGKMQFSFEEVNDLSASLNALNKLSNYRYAR